VCAHFSGATLVIVVRGGFSFSLRVIKSGEEKNGRDKRCERNFRFVICTSVAARLVVVVVGAADDDDVDEEIFLLRHLRNKK
jgi:hypothetical protein